jgi:hypothetical protein
MIFPRPLSQREREVLDRLLSKEFSGADAFSAQLDALEVIAPCPDCPCPSIELRVDPSKAQAAPHDASVAGHRPLPVQAAGPGCDVIVFHDNGWLAYLECVVHDSDSEPLNGLPPPDQLDVYTLPVQG